MDYRDKLIEKNFILVVLNCFMARRRYSVIITIPLGLAYNIRVLDAGGNKISVDQARMIARRSPVDSIGHIQ